MMNVFENKKGKIILLKMVKTIQENKVYLGDLDGLIGDGDHGMNMNKGFSLFEKRYCKNDFRFTDGLKNLGMLLMNEIGGSMGPIYGTIFTGMAEASEKLETISLKDFSEILEAGYNGLMEIVEARAGDKTLVDTLFPTLKSLKTDVVLGVDFVVALDKMKAAAKQGSESTKDMVARYGRSSRLGERSRGVLDTGSVSCYLILAAMADGIKEILEEL
ncbi:dihydroxyacetone kinase subunit DhaL [Propionispira raffinosivorans]|uniref:dihydroxyacetone kinase subunit DhaL n=1 Tax=Propionispira raffinosivorans TaxID=86959 RepID=UPI00039DFE10|nr:dihydroxyacetone kinase subunit DhaL [Propionispira raffinosivorans]